MKKQSYRFLQADIWPHAGAFIIIRNVIALLLLKDRGWGEKKDRALDIKYVPGINAEPTSLLYISQPVTVTSLHDGAIVSP